MYTYPLYQHQTCNIHLPTRWRLELLKKINEAPNIAAFTPATGWVCGHYSMNIMNAVNLYAVKIFIEIQTAVERYLPELYQSKHYFICEAGTRRDAKRAPLLSTPFALLFILLSGL